MSRSCTVCIHDRREDIDIALVRGVSVRAVEASYGVTYRSAQRHKENHLSPTLIRTMEARQAGIEGNVADHVRRLLGDSYDLMERAKETGDIRLAVTAMGNLRETLKLLGDATGELNRNQPATVINLNTDPQIAELKSIILGALDPYPEAAQAVAAALARRTQAQASIEATAHGYAVEPSTAAGDLPPTTTTERD